MCWDIYKQGSFQEAILPSPTTTHMHCFINIAFQGSIWKSTVICLHVIVFFFFFLFLSFFFFFPHKSFGCRSFFFSFLFFFFFFLTNLLVVDLSSSSSYSDRIGPNWGCFGQFLGQLRWISTDFGRFRPESAQIEDQKNKIKWQIGASKQVGCERRTHASQKYVFNWTTKFSTSSRVWWFVFLQSVHNKYRGVNFLFDFHLSEEYSLWSLNSVGLMLILYTICKEHNIRWPLICCA